MKGKVKERRAYAGFVLVLRLRLLPLFGGQPDNRVYHTVIGFCRKEDLVMGYNYRHGLFAVSHLSPLDGERSDSQGFLPCFPGTEFAGAWLVPESR